MRPSRPWIGLRFQYLGATGRFPAAADFSGSAGCPFEFAIGTLPDNRRNFGPLEQIQVGRIGNGVWQACASAAVTWGPTSRAPELPRRWAIASWPIPRRARRRTRSARQEMPCCLRYEPSADSSCPAGGSIPAEPGFAPSGDPPGGKPVMRMPAQETCCWRAALCARWRAAFPCSARDRYALLRRSDSCSRTSPRISRPARAAH